MEVKERKVEVKGRKVEVKGATAEDVTAPRAKLETVEKACRH